MVSSKSLAGCSDDPKRKLRLQGGRDDQSPSSKGLLVLSLRPYPPLHRRATADLGSHAPRWDPLHANEDSREQGEVLRRGSLISANDVWSFTRRGASSVWGLVRQMFQKKKRKKKGGNVIDSVFAGSFAGILDLCNQVGARSCLLCFTAAV